MGDLDPGVLLQYILLHCLPPRVQHALAASEADSLEKLADEADKILDFPRPSPPASFSASRGSHLCSPAVFIAPPSHDEESYSDQPEVNRLGLLWFL